MEVELVEFVIFDDKWKALSEISTPPVNLKIVIKEMLYLFLVI
jgi:hypothetical protein